MQKVPSNFNNMQRTKPEPVLDHEDQEIVNMRQKEEVRVFAVDMWL